MSSSDWNEGSEATDRYGPTLDKYLRDGHFDLSEREPPTPEEVAEVLEAIREDLDVSYKDFEKILLMEKSPACVNLYLLLVTPDDEWIGIFPACINLLRTHCNAEGNGILDYAYGFLCLRVMSLVVQLAMLANNLSGESQFFGPFYLATTLLPEGQSIHPILLKYLAELFDWAKGLKSDERDVTLFGISYNTSTRKVVSLPHTGDCTIPDGEFIIEQLWSARDKFLFAARWATNLFPGWGLMLDMIRALFAAPHLCSSIPMSTWTISDDDRTWVRFIDVATRYSLCCNESEDDRLGAMLLNFPEAAKKAFEEKKYQDSTSKLDATQIVVDASNKLKSCTDRHKHTSFKGFLYGCKHISIDNAESLGRTIFDAFFDRIWTEICRYEKPREGQYHRLLHGCTVMTHAYALLTGKYPTKFTFFLDLLSEKIIEVHGRIILLPVLTRTLDEVAPMMDMYEYQFRTWTSGLTAGLMHHRIKVPAHLKASLFPLWYRVYDHFKSSADSKDVPRQSFEQKYFHSWTSSWMSLGTMFGMDRVLQHSLVCSYPRCPNPSVLLCWRCSGCGEKRYCTKKCQSADWEHMPDPHKANCYRV